MQAALALFLGILGGIGVLEDKPPPVIAVREIDRRALEVER